MKTIEKVFNRLEDLNISIYNYEENGVLCGYELNTYTNAGVNMIVFVDFRDTDTDPKNGKHFIELFNETVSYVDIDEELQLHLQDERYRNEIGATIGVTDFKDWKENLLNIFSDKTPQQRQFEQVVDKLRSQVDAMRETLEMMPKKGDTSYDCQRHNILCTLLTLEHEINGIELEDFTPNEYSGNFKLSYS
jgi:hypothetical protein